MGVHDSGPRCVLAVRQFVDQQIINPRLLEGDCQSEAGGACAND
jgi:hypothetical protein